MCPEQVEEPDLLFKCDLPANAASLVDIHNALVDEVKRLREELLKVHIAAGGW